MCGSGHAGERALRSAPNDLMKLPGNHHPVPEALAAEARGRFETLSSTTPSWPPQQATPFSLARLAAARLDCGLRRVVRKAPAPSSSGTKPFPALSSSPPPLLSAGR